MGRVFHYIKRWPCGGGMETILRYHFPEQDRSTNTDGDQRIELQPASNGAWSSIRTLASNSHLKSANSSGNLHLHYNGYGIDWDYDGVKSGNRWIYLHTDYPRLGQWLSRAGRHAAGVVCVSDTLAEKVKSVLPHLTEDRIWTVPLPVATAENHDGSVDPFKRDLVIGYAGRVQVEQKRLDRVAGFLQQLDVSNINYRMEFLGSGKAEEKLRRKFNSNSRVVFHGHKTGRAYWDVLKKWRYMVFFSDYEGLPLTLLEGLGAGVIPVYPDHYDGRGRFARSFPDSLYEAGNPVAAARLIVNMETGAPGRTIETLRERTTKFLAPHNKQSYLEKFRQWNRAAESPDGAIRNACFPAFLPAWVYHRYNRILQSGTIL